MTRSERMQPIKALADTRERDAGAGVAAARRVLEDREKQLEQLRGYRAEYAGRAAREGAADAVRLQNYHAFLGRLGDAIRQQEELVAAARQDLEHRTTAWQERRIEAASLGKAVERIAGSEQKAADRRDQRDADERALRARPPRD
jgi:flagellar FliJ protein